MIKKIEIYPFKTLQLLNFIINNNKKRKEKIIIKPHHPTKVKIKYKGKRFKGKIVWWK